MRKALLCIAIAALLFVVAPALYAASITHGSGAPSDAIGANGDFYFNIVTRQLHGPKSGGTWPAIERSYEYTIDTLTNVPAADPDKIVDNQDVADGALTGTDANPLFARNLVFAITDADTSIDAYTLVIVGTDQFGNAISDTFTFEDGLTGSTEQAYMTVTSATMADTNGVDDGTDVIDIGTSVLVGLSQALGDNGGATGVYRFVVGTTITTIPAVDTDFNTIDLTDSAPDGSKDYTIYMKALR